MSRSVVFLCCAAVVLALQIVLALWYFRRYKGARSTEWQFIMNRLIRLDRSNIATVALDFVDEHGNRREPGTEDLDPDSIWDLLGGLDGLEAIEANSAVLVDLASHLQLWYPEALTVAENLRINAREIQFHVTRLRGAKRTGNIRTAFPDYGQKVAARYYMMSKSLVALYERASSPQLSELRTSV